MSSYKDALKHFLKDDPSINGRVEMMEPKKRKQVNFKGTTTEEGNNKKRKYPTPYFKSRNHKTSIDDGNVKLTFEEDSPIKTPVSKRRISKTSKYMADDWVNEESLLISPSTSEVCYSSPVYKKELHTSTKIDTTYFKPAEDTNQNDFISTLFLSGSDSGSSDTSSIPDSYLPLQNNIHFSLPADTPSCSMMAYEENDDTSSTKDTPDISSECAFEGRLESSSQSSVSEDDLECTSKVEEDLEYNSKVEEDVEHTSKVEEDSCILYQVPQGQILVLKDTSPIYFHGIFLLTVIYGEVDLLGHRLTPSSREAKVYSPRGASYLFVKRPFREEYSGDMYTVILDMLLNASINENDAIKLARIISPSDSILLCKFYSSQKFLYLEKHVSQQLLPKPDGKCIFQLEKGDWNVIKFNPDWEQLLEDVRMKSRIMFCGGKSVGKSTLLRFAINSLLMSYETVLVIDLDPGQPEFTVPGCVSATIVSEPVFGPNYTHLQKPARCVFMNNINVAYEPNMYINCVRELLDQCSDLDLEMPTLINYMGYSRGLGLNLVAAIISYVQPTKVIQIQSKKSQRNYSKKLTFDVVNKNFNLLNSSDNIVEYDLMELEAMNDDNEGWQMEPRIIREMCLLSYFSQALDPDSLSLTSSKVAMYKINLKDVHIVDSEKINSPLVANANLVGLCSPGKRDGAYTCYGWGIVRGIDLKKNELILITPISADDLENVSHLVVGAVTLPPSVYMTDDNKQGHVPFVSVGSFSDFNSIPKRSYLPKNTYRAQVSKSPK